MPTLPLHQSNMHYLKFRDIYEEVIPEEGTICMEDMTGNWVYFRYKEK